MGVYRLGILKGERVYNFWGSVVVLMFWFTSN